MNDHTNDQRSKYMNIRTDRRIDERTDGPTEDPQCLFAASLFNIDGKPNEFVGQVYTYFIKLIACL